MDRSARFTKPCARPNRPRRIIISRQVIWSIGLLGAGLLIAFVLIALRPQAKGEEPIAQALLVETIVFEAASGPIPVRASGTVEAFDEVVVGVQVSGRVTYLNPAFREGGRLGKGATILRIDEAEYINRVNMAEADVAAQEVAVLQAQQEVAIARNELELFAEREAQMETTRAATSDAVILPPKLRGSSAPKIDGAAGTVPGQGSSDTSELATREPQLRSAEASSERATASVSDAQLALARTRVTAPFSGLVRQSDVAIGTLVQPGQAIGSMVATNAYEVRVTLSPEESALIPGLFDGSRARIPAVVFSEYGGQTYRWPAYVDRASAALDATTRNVEIFLRVPSPLTSGRLIDVSDTDGAPKKAPPLLVGAFVQAQITGSSIERYAAVPASTVRPGNEVWVVRENKLVVLKVRVIQRRDDVAYITTPSLSEGGRLVVSNLRAPVEGMAVRVARTGSR